MPPGALAHAIERSRGGRTTKLPALVDGQGRPVTLAITPGQHGDAPAAIGLLRQAPPSGMVTADSAYDSNALRAFLIERGTTPVIPVTRHASNTMLSIEPPTGDATSSNAR